jgi:hypothetical protein
MEHYGVPTPLLDWSDGALAAVAQILRDTGGHHSRETPITSNPLKRLGGTRWNAGVENSIFKCRPLGSK